VEESALGSSGTGCFAAEACPANMSMTTKQLRATSLEVVCALDLDSDFSTPASAVKCARFSP
jgi:hypothetical protein